MKEFKVNMSTLRIGRTWNADMKDKRTMYVPRIRDGKSGGRGGRRPCYFYLQVCKFFFFFSRAFLKLFSFFVQLLALLLTFEGF